MPIEKLKLLIFFTILDLLKPLIFLTEGSGKIPTIPLY